MDELKLSSMASRALLRSKLNRALRDLPVLPTVVMQILRETNNPEVSAAKIEEIILKDQALTAQVLRVVNSSYYGLAGQVSSVSQAILVLGLQQIRNLVLSMAASTSFMTDGQCQRDILMKFWQHAFATATTTQVLRQFKSVPPREAEALYVGGLIHDIGRLFLCSQFEQPYARVFALVEETDVTIEAAESEVFGMNHSEVGHELAKAWLFPEPLFSIIGKHEGPFDETTPSYVHLVHIADALNKHFYFPTTQTPQQLIHPLSWEWFGFTEANFGAVTLEVANRVESASELYKAMAA